MLLIQSYKGETVFKGEGVGVYWDKNCDNPIINVSWGLISPKPFDGGNYKNLTIYVRNEEGFPIKLELGMTKISPNSLTKYTNIKWDYLNETLQPNDIVKVNLVFSIDSNILFEIPPVTEYSIEIVIQGITR